jgi:hypothetical protein
MACLPDGASILADAAPRQPALSERMESASRRACPERAHGAYSRITFFDWRSASIALSITPIRKVDGFAYDVNEDSQ